MDFAKQDGTTSVKVHHAPGGKSNFSLAWDEGPKQNNPQKKQVSNQQPPPIQQPKIEQKITQQTQQKDVKTSVKVHNPPGGKSNFTLG